MSEHDILMLLIGLNVGVLVGLIAIVTVGVVVIYRLLTGENL